MIDLALLAIVDLNRLIKLLGTIPECITYGTDILHNFTIYGLPSFCLHLI